MVTGLFLTSSLESGPASELAWVLKRLEMDHLESSFRSVADQEEGAKRR